MNWCDDKQLGIISLTLIALAVIFKLDGQIAQQIVVPIISGLAGLVTGQVLASKKGLTDNELSPPTVKK